MPIRFMGYESLFYQSLMASQPAATHRKLPPVIPVLLYDGIEPWNVATDLGSLIGDLDPGSLPDREEPRLAGGPGERSPLAAEHPGGRGERVLTAASLQEIFGE
jgi:hypothetical protein